MKEIPLTQGQIALVDDEDYENLIQYKWQAQINRKKDAYYVVRTGGINMAQQILGYYGRMLIDHKDGNPLNNQRNNLRLCTNQYNQMNRKPNKNSLSRFKGITLNRYDHRWHVRIVHNKKRISLGEYTTEKEAALAYNEAAIKYFGEFARLNVIEEDEV